MKKLALKYLLKKLIILNEIEIHMLKKILDKSKLISLEEESHTYTLLNSTIEFKSVTEFIHSFFKPFDEKKLLKNLLKLI